MAGWTTDELTKIGEADELQLSSLRRDGSLRNPVTMWVIRDGDELYVRSMHGRAGAWFRATQTRRQGHIRSGGIDKDVAFMVVADDAVHKPGSSRLGRGSDEPGASRLGRALNEPGSSRLGRALNERIDQAYRGKYRRYGANVVGGVVNPQARASTIKLVPR